MAEDPTYAYNIILTKIGQCRELFKSIYKKGINADGELLARFNEILRKSRDSTDIIIKQLDQLNELLTNEKQVFKRGDIGTPEESITDGPSHKVYMMPTTTTRINATPYSVLHKIQIDGKPVVYSRYRSKYNAFKKHVEQIINNISIREDIKEAFVNAQLQLDIRAKSFEEVKKNTNIAFKLVYENKACRVGATKAAYEALFGLNDFINQIIAIDNPGVPMIEP